MQLLTGIACCLLLLVNAHSATVVIDFEELAQGASNPTSKGFTFTSPYAVSPPYTDPNLVYPNVQVVSANVGGSSTFPPGNINAVRAQVYYADYADAFYHFLDFKSLDSTPFDLQSMLITVVGQDYRPAIFTGHYVGGGSIVYEQIYGQRDVVFGADWNNLSYVSVSLVTDAQSEGYSDIVLDNIKVNVSAVPVPAAVWFFASGLGLLGWLSRGRAA